MTLMSRSSRATFRVAIGQIAPTLGNLAANARMHAEQIDEARARECDLIVFPELSLTGYYLRDQVPEVAEPRDGCLVNGIIATAGDLSVAFGFVEEALGALFYNTAGFVTDGELAYSHRKVYLPTYGMFDERRYFAAGDRFRSVETKFGRIGFLICEDAWHLSAAVIYQAANIDVLIMMANSPARGVGQPDLSSATSWSLLSQTYANFLNVPVIVANRVGYEDGICFFGGSHIRDTGGELLAEAPLLEAALITADIDPRVSRRHRIRTPLFRDERLDLTIRELERLRNASLNDQV